MIRNLLIELSRIGILLVTVCTSVVAVAGPSDDSINKIFDRVHRPAVELMASFYDQSDFLVLENSNHLNYKVYRDLLALLARVGRDPHLKYIVMERYSDAARFYERLSVEPLDAAVQELPSVFAQRNTLCRSPEWAYFIANVMPEIRRINLQRPADNPLLVTSIDGMSAERDMLWPASSDLSFDWERYLRETKTERDAGCEESLPSSTLITSRTRETRTYKNFQRLAQKLRKGDKTIVVYHYVHAIQQVESCASEMISPRHWIARRGPMSWMEMATQKIPTLAARSKSILFDEIEYTSSSAGVLKLNDTLAKAHPKENFAYELAPFSDVIDERGLAVFNPDAMISSYHSPASSARIADFFDGVVWNHDSEKIYRLSTHSYDYLPNDCESTKLVIRTSESH